MASRRKPARRHRTTPRHYRRLAARAPLFALVCGCDTFLPAPQSRVGPLPSTGSTHRPARTRTERPFPAPHRRPAGRYRRVHIRRLRARIRRGSRLLSVKAFPSAAVLAAGGWPCSAALGRVRGSMCRAWVHHRCAGRGYPSCSERRSPGASASRRWMSWRATWRPGSVVLPSASAEARAGQLRSASARPFGLK